MLFVSGKGLKPRYLILCCSSFLHSTFDCWRGCVVCDTCHLVGIFGRVILFCHHCSWIALVLVFEHIASAAKFTNTFPSQLLQKSSSLMPVLFASISYISHPMFSNRAGHPDICRMGCFPHSATTAGVHYFTVLVKLNSMSCCFLPGQCTSTCLIVSGYVERDRM